MAAHLVSAVVWTNMDDADDVSGPHKGVCLPKYLLEMAAEQFYSRVRGHFTNGHMTYQDFLQASMSEMQASKDRHEVANIKIKRMHMFIRRFTDGYRER
eukprot:12399972-Karenia_brevis.AAC.1